MSKKKFSKEDIEAAYIAGGKAAIEEIQREMRKSEKINNKKGKKKHDKKRRDDKISPKKKFKQCEEESRFELAKLMCRINGIPISTYFKKTENGLESKPVSCRVTELDKTDFVNLSKLQWTKNLSYQTDSTIFKMRFLTCFTEEISNKLGSIAKNRHRSNVINEEFGKYENGYFHMKTIVDDCLKLEKCLSYSECKDLTNILLKNIFNSMYSSKDFSSKSLNGEILKTKKDLLVGLNPSNIFSDKLVDDDVAMMFVMRLAWFLATGDNQMIPIFKQIENLKRTDDITRILSILGKSIINVRDIMDTPIVAKAFHDAHPCVKTKYTNVYSDSNLAVAIESILLADFVLNDKNVHKLISKMVGLEEEESFFSRIKIF